MAKEFDVLKEQANVIKNEVEDGANTASRVGGMFEDIVDRMQSGVTEVNVSQLYPTDGTDGSNKYTLETAIAKVGEELRHAGLKVTFLNGEGKTETWEYQSGTFTLFTSWIQVVKMSDLDDIEFVNDSYLKALSEDLFELIDVELTEGGYIGSNGKVVSLNRSYYSNFIKVSYEFIYYWKFTQGVTQIALYSTDSEDSFIKVLEGGLINISMQTAYVRLSFYKDGGIDNLPNKVYLLRRTKSKRDILKQDIAQIALNGMVNLFNAGFSSGYYYNSGNLNSDDSFIHSIFIPISIGNVYISKNYYSKSYAIALFRYDLSFHSMLEAEQITEDGRGAVVDLSNVAGLGLGYFVVNLRKNTSNKFIVRESDKDLPDYNVTIIHDFSYDKEAIKEAVGLNFQELETTNLLDEVEYAGGYITSDGSISGSGIAGFSHTETYIPVIGNKYYFSNGNDIAFAAGGGLYDSDKVFKKRVLFIEDTSFQPIDVSGYSYIRLNVRNVEKANAVLLSEEDYAKYGKISIPDLYIPELNKEADTYIYNEYMHNDTTFIGAMNSIVDAIFEANPLSKIVFISHYTLDGGSGNYDLENLVKEQLLLARRFCSHIVKLYDKFNWFNKGDISTNVLQAFIKDQLHPASNLENISRIANYIANDIKWIFGSWTKKKVYWAGTSIPAGFSRPEEASDLESEYPLQVAQILGCIVENSSVAGACARSKKADGTELSDYSYYEHIDELVSLIGTDNEPDLWVFDLGINDISRDRTDFLDDNINLSNIHV